MGFQLLYSVQKSSNTLVRKDVQGKCEQEEECGASKVQAGRLES